MYVMDFISPAVGQTRSKKVKWTPEMDAQLRVFGRQPRGGGRIPWRDLSIQGVPESEGKSMVFRNRWNKIKNP